MRCGRGSRVEIVKCTSYAERGADPRGCRRSGRVKRGVRGGGDRSLLPFVLAVQGATA
jgi:hypothetical protein